MAIEYELKFTGKQVEDILDKANKLDSTIEQAIIQAKTEITSQINNKANSTDVYNKTELSNKILPDVTVNDAGKILRVDNNGTWVAETLRVYNGEVIE